MSDSYLKIVPEVKVSTSYGVDNKPEWSLVLIEMEYWRKFFGDDHQERAHMMVQELNEVIQGMAGKLRDIVDRYKPTEET